MDDFWKTLLWQQFGAAIDMLEDATRACPDGTVHTRRIGSVGIASRATLYKG